MDSGMVAMSCTIPSTWKLMDRMRFRQFHNVVTFGKPADQLRSHQPQKIIGACSSAMQEKRPCRLDVLNQRNAREENVMNANATL